MKTIYIVEDDDAIREILEVFLESENYDVQSFGSATEFSNRDLSYTPDLYLFDVRLPDGSGIELCQQIREEKVNEGVPVFIMSAHAQYGETQIACRPDAFIAKPFDINLMLERIQYFVN
ncbi:hypothetical protein ASG01_00295 [Chryseobacterium sp. Leaf180]|uniref:response regulator transcription factor n=1 Tax=Chryseobacterium sp. Leaf180 TaxID=1736289 RepID=UPI0006FF0996|nr:response regulator [Chryseobacterium sp. Leaf180]KQR94363.1 hypothetical protein ASG01_00295 [Chryseobacterium sp. Leaf180]